MFSVRVQLCGKIPTHVPFTVVVSTPHVEGSDACEGVDASDGGDMLHTAPNTSSRLIFEIHTFFYVHTLIDLDYWRPLSTTHRVSRSRLLSASIARSR